VGDFVYMQRTSGGKLLESKARREILRLKQLGKVGTLKLEGRCGTEVVVNAGGRLRDVSFGAFVSGAQAP